MSQSSSLADDEFAARLRGKLQFCNDVAQKIMNEQNAQKQANSKDKKESAAADITTDSGSSDRTGNDLASAIHPRGQFRHDVGTTEESLVSQMSGSPSTFRN